MLDTESAPQPERGPEDRLDSWKAIAAYLGRDVSTVRRWERTEGLPVHRHRHAARGSAYAYSSELDAWFASRRAALETNGRDPTAATAAAATWPDDGLVDDQPSHVAAPRSPGWRSAAWVALAGALATAVVLAALYSRQRSSTPSTRFQPRDWILVGEIENRTGDPRLNDSVQFALERELSASSFVNVVSRERIVDTLRLMKKPLDTRLDRATGLEVCLRDGGIRALLTGRVEKFGGTYVLAALIVDPNESGRTIAAAEGRAADEGQILDAVHGLSDRLRQALGEESRNVQNAPVRLERGVMTGSLEALQLYTQGIDAVNRREWRVGATFLQRAVDADPTFAAAQIYLAYCLMNTGGSPQEYLPHAREAARLAEHQNDREQYFILASYQHLSGNLDKAAGLYETLLQLHPDHFWGASNLDNLYRMLDRNSERWPSMERLMRARPNDFVTAARTIQVGLAEGIGLDRIDTMAAHARQLTPDTTLWDLSVFLDCLPAYEAWLRDDVPGMIRLAEAIGRRSPRHAKKGALLELASGRIAAAEKLLANAGDRDENDREGDLALLSYLRGDRRAVATHLAGAERNYGNQLTLVVWLAMQIDPQKGERFFREWLTRPDDGHTPPANSEWADTVRAELRLRRRDPTAVSELENAARLIDRGRPRHLRAFEALADAFAADGEFGKSAAVLEQATRTKARALSYSPGGETFGGIFWLRLRAKLARAYRGMGRVEDAERVDAEVAKMLAFADSDFRLLP